MKEVAWLTICVVLCGCAGTRNLSLETNFPVPLVQKADVNMGIHLDEALRSFTYNEVIEGKGEWNVDVGSVQTDLFQRLASGMFNDHSILTEVESIPAVTVAGVDGVLQPTITDLQFSLPDQTRSNYYEV